MQWTITRKLFLALLVISLLVLLMSALFGRLSFQRGFSTYLAAQEAPQVNRLAADLVTEYETDGWNSLRSDPRVWDELIRQSAPYARRRHDRGPGPRSGPRSDLTAGSRPGSRPESRSGPPGGRPPPGVDHGPRPGRPGSPRPESLGTDPGRIEDRIGLFGMDGIQIASSDAVVAAVAVADYSTTAVIVNGEPVGELRVLPAAHLSSDLDIAFDKSQRRSLVWIAVLLIGLAWIASWLMARQFTKPIRSLARGTRSISEGDYNEPIAVASKDELGALATDVNSLARVLSANRESRRRWLGDINHELRTPLTILTAELQSLEDGYRPFDAAAVSSLQNEVDRLSKLVEDLYSLSASDESNLEYRFSEFDVVDLLRERIEGVTGQLEQKGLRLQSALPDQPILLSADATRIGQLFTNLLENAISYTDSPGVINVSCQSSGSNFHFAIEDSPPGVPADLRLRIFERLYRVDPSRNRRSGGSGLGLSICSAIVAAHGGSIEARESSLNGLGIDVQLPLKQLGG